MAFLTSYRAEKVYFEKLRSNIDIAKSYIQRGATDEVMALLQNAVDADGAIMLCYRNLGEVWADLAAQLEKTQKALEDLKTALEEYHDDLNKKIDEINNYLVRLINALDDRVTILENESKVKFAYLNHDSVEDIYSIEYNGETADFEALSAALEYPHLLVLIDNENGNIYYPCSVSDVLIDFHADGVSGTDYVDISVTMSDSDVVSVTEKIVVNYTFGAGFNVSNTNEVTPDLTVLQAKLSAGFGIEIDSNNEISVDTNDVQEKLIAGQNITLTPDTTDPTKTVIEAAGANYSAGFGIDIDQNNEISVDTNDVQEKLIAGQNITLTPDATDPTKTVIDVSGVISDYDFLQASYTFYSQIEQMAVYGTNGSFGKNVDCPNFSTNDVANLENKQHIVLYNAVNGEDQPTGFLTDTSKQITLYIWALVQVVDNTLAKTITLANFYNVCGLHFSGEASFKNNVFYSQEIIESAEKLYETIKNNPANYKFRLQYQVIPVVDGKIPTQSEWGNIATSVGLKLVNRIYFRA